MFAKALHEKLNIPWLTVVAEIAKSRYEGKRLPRAKRASRQLLPVFPELLEVLAVTWKDKPFLYPHPVYVHTQQGEFQLPGLYLRESRYRIFVKRRVGPRCIHLQGSINWMLQLRL